MRSSPARSKSDVLYYVGAVCIVCTSLRTCHIRLVLSNKLINEILWSVIDLIFSIRQGARRTVQVDNSLARWNYESIGFGL